MNEKDRIPVGDRDLVFFDTETTGFSILQNELIEIGYVKAKAHTFEVIEEGDIKIKPTHIETADKEALEIVGYDPVEWKDAYDLKSGLEEFLSKTRDVVLVGHALPFDWMHLNKAMEECGLSQNFLYKGFDTFALSWFMLDKVEGVERYSLKELSRFFGIDQGQAHRAIDDARTTYQIFLKLIKLRDEK